MRYPVARAQQQALDNPRCLMALTMRYAVGVLASLLTVFVCSGLLVYWIARTFMLVRASLAVASHEEITATLEYDSWVCRTFISRLCAMFLPPPSII